MDSIKLAACADSSYEYSQSQPMPRCQTRMGRWEPSVETSKHPKASIQRHSPPITVHTEHGSLMYWGPCQHLAPACSGRRDVGRPVQARWVNEDGQPVVHLLQVFLHDARRHIEHRVALYVPAPPGGCMSFTASPLTCCQHAVQHLCGGSSTCQTLDMEP